MVRILKSEASANPRINAVLPDAALPGGEIEVHGLNLGANGLQRPLSAIGGSTATILLSRNTRLVVRVPEADSTSNVFLLALATKSRVPNHNSQPVGM